MTKAWYAVHTYSGHENKVKTNIERRAESLGLRDKISRILVPVEEEQRNRNGRRTSIKRKVFPGYVLIEMDLNDQTWYLVKNTIGVTGFVSSGNKPVPLQAREIANILESLEDGTRKAKPAWQKGEVVRVNSGPFADFTGTIEDINPDNEKVKVLISIFGRDTPVEMSFAEIERV
ncbi:MAG: transcription termination/antitermination factor NusG [Armatimonadetes bacterium]|nr:transcription termination/antitermination factor NusG [Armatimonadota bacterium]